jgi:DNA-binding response OmpR family regulator
MMVDGDINLARAVKSGLEATGQYEVCVLAFDWWSDQESKVIREFQPGIVLLDAWAATKMSKMSGNDITKPFAKDAFARKIPIIFLTPDPSEHIDPDPGVDFPKFENSIEKPFSLARLINRMEAIAKWPKP